MLLAVPQSKQKSTGDWSFCVLAPKLWKNLPLYIHLAQSVEIFKSQPKSYHYTLTFELGEP